MVFRIRRATIPLVLVSALVGTAQAQSHSLHLGPRVSYQLDLEKLPSEANRRRLGPALGYFLELTGRLGSWSGYDRAVKKKEICAARCRSDVRFGSKADMCVALAYVCFGPIADSRS